MTINNLQKAASEVGSSTHWNDGWRLTGTNEASDRASNVGGIASGTMTVTNNVMPSIARPQMTPDASLESTSAIEKSSVTIIATPIEATSLPNEPSNSEINTPNETDVSTSTGNFQTTSIATDPTTTTSESISTPTCSHATSDSNSFHSDCDSMMGISNNTNKLNAGTIAGIAVAFVAVLVAVGALAWYCWKRKAPRNEKDLEKIMFWAKPKKEAGSDFNFQKGPMNDMLSGQGRNTQGQKKQGDPRHRNIDMSFPRTDHTVMTEDVLGSSGSHLRSDETEDPFYTPFDSPDIRESQIGIALTRYSTRQSKKSTASTKSANIPNIPEQKLPPDQARPDIQVRSANVYIGHARAENIKEKRVTSMVPQIVNIPKPQRSNSSVTTRPRSRSLSPNAYGSAPARPEKLARYYDMHTKSITVAKLSKSSTDPRLAETATENLRSAGRPRSEMMLPTALADSSRPATDCEISGTHVCAPATRYKCPFSTVQLNRVAAAVRQLEDNNTDNTVPTETQADWARRWLEHMRARNESVNEPAQGQD